MELKDKIKEVSEELAQDIVDMTFLDKEEIAVKIRIRIKEIVKLVEGK